MNNWYVCLKYGTAWVDNISNMHADYNYGQQIWYFASQEEAENFLQSLQED